jgi:hypothetical protein
MMPMVTEKSARFAGHHEAAAKERAGAVAERERLAIAERLHPEWA